MQMSVFYNGSKTSDYELPQYSQLSSQAEEECSLVHWARCLWPASAPTPVMLLYEDELARAGVQNVDEGSYSSNCQGGEVTHRLVRCNPHGHPATAAMSQVH